MSRVGGRRRRGESEQCLRHPLHLLLVGPAVDADGLLDLRRWVLDKGKACVRTGTRSAPRTAATSRAGVSEGKSEREAIRCLKRHVARRLFRLLERSAVMA